jgi:hypothetical protein
VKKRGRKGGERKRGVWCGVVVEMRKREGGECEREREGGGCERERE